MFDASELFFSYAIACTFTDPDPQGIDTDLFARRKPHFLHDVPRTGRGGVDARSGHPAPAREALSTVCLWRISSQGLSLESVRYLQFQSLRVIRNSDTEAIAIAHFEAPDAMERTTGLHRRLGLTRISCGEPTANFVAAALAAFRCKNRVILPRQS